MALVEKEWSESLVRELNQEIHGLRAENAELKFHLYLHLPELVVGRQNGSGSRQNFLPAGSGALYSFSPSLPCKNSVKDASTSTTPTPTPTSTPLEKIHKQKEKAACTECANRQTAFAKNKEAEKRLQQELESAENVIAKLKWVQLNQTEKLIHQEIKVQELQKEVQHLQSTGLEIFSLQIPSPISPTGGHTSSHYSSTILVENSYATPSTTPTPTSTPPLQRRRHNSSSKSGSYSRRGSTQSLLPDDYKSSVSSLPPIEVGGGGGVEDVLLTKLKALPQLPLHPTNGRNPSNIPNIGKVNGSNQKMPRFRQAPLPIPGSIMNTATAATAASSVNNSHSRPLKAGHKL